jgi:hypothetical protein
VTATSNPGVVIDAIDGDALAPPLRRPRLRAHRSLVLGVALALTAAMLGLGIRNAERDMDAVRDDLAAADRALRNEELAVVAAGERRRETEATLQATLTRLGEAQEARQAVRTLYEAISKDLEAQRAMLRTTEIDLYTRAYQLGQLEQCLTGVAAAMRQASYDADEAVLETLASVASVCEAARGLTGGQ